MATRNNGSNSEIEFKVKAEDHTSETSSVTEVKLEITNRMTVQASSTLMESFDPDNSVNLGPRWEKWLSRLNRFFLANGWKVEENATQMEAMLFLLAGPRVEEIHGTLGEAVTLPTGSPEDAFTKAAARLNAYFKPKRNHMMEKFNFRTAKQEESETIETYVTRLRLLAKHCEFSNVDTEIMTQVVLSCHSTKLRRELLKVEDLKMEKLLSLGRVHDTLNDQVERVEGKSTEQDEDYERVEAFNSKRKPFRKLEASQPFRRQGVQSGKSGVKTEKKCFKCGGSYPHVQECPAIGKRCRKCNQLGHFEICCRSKDFKLSNKVEQVTQRVKFNMEPDSVFVAIQAESKSPTVKMKMCGTDVIFRIDTGATVNVCDKETYNKLSTRPMLKKYYKETFGYGNVKLNTLGQFTAALEHNHRIVHKKFVVIDGNCGCLLSCSTSVELGLVMMGESVEPVNTGGSTFTSSKITSEVTSSNYKNLNSMERKTYWKRRFPEVFSDKLGKLKNFQVMLHIDENVKPVQAKPRHKPYHLREAIEKELQSKLDSGVIEKVEGEPTDWLSETVVVPKKDSNKIRLCTDMSAANQAIKCEKYEMPNVEDIIYQANGASFFTKMDLNQAFEQLELHPACRHITRFRTHTGIYQNARLCFGVNSAPEVFHNKIRSLLEGLVGVQNAADDILIMSKTLEEDWERTDQVLNVLRDNGLTVNPEKCEFGN